jgi:hypothetical protein
VYALRVSMDPGDTDERILAELAEFAAAGRIDDVTVVANAGELNTGHTDEAERTLYRHLAVRTAMAAGAGVSMSLNPWHTLMPGDFGKGLRPGQDFRLMVDPTGRQATLAVCPLDPAWRGYIADLYGYYAAARPRFLWVEDDFRYHNHHPLAWGGCFCDAHLAEFSRLAGRDVGRAEFVAGLLAPGAPHPFRRVWLETARRALEEVAAAIEWAVHAVSPDTRLGLMTSPPGVHAAEGRRWEPLLRALSGPHRPAVGVHLPADAERRPAAYLGLFHANADAHRALLPPDAEVYPVLGGFPYSRFAQSRAFTRFQLLGAQVLNPAGVTVDLFDRNGNGPVSGEGYQDTLAEAKDYLAAGRAGGVFAGPRAGVAVLIAEDAAASLHTRAGQSMAELYPREYLFGALLGGYGIPFRYTADATLTGEVVAVSGQSCRALGAKAARRLCAANRLILDGEAVETLLSLGLGDVVAARSLKWTGSEDGRVTYEEAIGDLTLTGHAEARMSVLMMGAEAALIGYDEGRMGALTRFCRHGHVDVAPGHTLVDGRILVVPFGRIPADAGLPAMLRTTARQELFQSVLAAWAPPWPLLLGEADVALYVYEPAWYVVNASLDAVSRLRFWVGDRVVTAVAAEPSQGPATRVAFTQAGPVLTVALGLPPLEAVLLRVT